MKIVRPATSTRDQQKYPAPQDYDSPWKDILARFFP
jgi:hypothetical protein